MAYSNLWLREKELKDIAVKVVPNIDGSFWGSSNLLWILLSHRLFKSLKQKIHAELYQQRVRCTNRRFWLRKMYKLSF